MRYRTRPAEVEATQWLKNGDHPDDQVGEVLADPAAPDDPSRRYTRLEGAVVRFYRLPGTGGVRCGAPNCGALFDDHGWLEATDTVVHPGDYIVHLGNRVVPKAAFEKSWEPVRVAADGSTLYTGGAVRRGW